MKRVLSAAAFAAMTSGCIPTSCVARGTRVLTPSGWRLIEELAVGDDVFAFDEDTGERFATPVVAIRSAMREVGLISLEHAEIRLTTDHPVYCPRDEVYAPAGDWLLGRRTQLAALGDSGFQVVDVRRTRIFVEVSEVFDITVAHEHHNFVANGVLVHNKSPAEYECTCPDGSVYYVTDNVCRDAERCDDTTVGADANNDTPDDMSSNNAADMPDVGSTDMSGGDTGSPDMGAPRHWGSCVTDDDCAMDTWTCVTIPAGEPNGYHTCQAAEAAAPGCAMIEDPDTCCVHADCNQADPTSVCVTGPIFYCGGVAPIIANVCMADECATDADCGQDAVCVPPRVLGEPVARCMPANCTTDADCTAGEAGQCTEFFDPCNRRMSGFACTYGDSVCRRDADCPGDGMGTPYCMMGDGQGATECGSFLPPP